MGLRCFLFGCKDNPIPKTENGYFIVAGKCVVCGKERVYLKEDIHSFYKKIRLDDFEKKLNLMRKLAK